MTKIIKNPNKTQSTFRKIKIFIAAALLSLAVHAAHFLTKVIKKELPISPN